MDHNSASHIRRSVWREPVLWLVLALPLGVLVAGALLIRTAVQAGPLESAPGVRRMGQVQVLVEPAPAAPPAIDRP